MNLLTLVHKSGIVNQFQIVNDLEDTENKTQVQLIWNRQIHCTVIGLNQDPDVHNEQQNTWHIKDYRAVYLNGIQVVKHGKVWPRRKLLDRILSK